MTTGWLNIAGRPLRPAQVTAPAPAPGQVRVKVQACGICRTDLHVVDGELKHPKLPLVPGHQIVGTVEALGEGVSSPGVGAQVGIPCFSRPFKDQSGAWRNGTSFGPSDLEALMNVAFEAKEWIAAHVLER